MPSRNNCKPIPQCKSTSVNNEVELRSLLSQQIHMITFSSVNTKHKLWSNHNTNCQSNKPIITQDKDMEQLIHCSARKAQQKPRKWYLTKRSYQNGRPNHWKWNMLFFRKFSLKTQFSPYFYPAYYLLTDWPGWTALTKGGTFFKRLDWYALQL